MLVPCINNSPLSMDVEEEWFVPLMWTWDMMDWSLEEHNKTKGFQLRHIRYWLKHNGISNDITIHCFMNRKGETVVSPLLSFCCVSTVQKGLIIGHHGLYYIFAFIKADMAINSTLTNFGTQPIYQIARVAQSPECCKVWFF